MPGYAQDASGGSCAMGIHHADVTGRPCSGYSFIHEYYCQKQCSDNIIIFFVCFQSEHLTEASKRARSDILRYEDRLLLGRLVSFLVEVDNFCAMVRSITFYINFNRAIVRCQRITLPSPHSFPTSWASKRLSKSELLVLSYLLY